MKFHPRIAFLLFFSLALNLKAQDPQDVVRISTNLVQVDVVVTKDGKQVTDLKAEDFEIREDGRLQHQFHLRFSQARCKYSGPVRNVARHVAR